MILIIWSAPNVLLFLGIYISSNMGVYILYLSDYLSIQLVQCCL